jgi:hypothetical protein
LAGYRAGLSLALPAFDTFGCLEKYARNPRNAACRLSYRALRVRARNELVYDALARTSSKTLARLLLSLRLGCTVDSVADAVIPYGEDEAREEDTPALFGSADELYKRLCKKYGVGVDLSDSLSASESVQSDTGTYSNDKE